MLRFLPVVQNGNWIKMYMYVLSMYCKVHVQYIYKYIKCVLHMQIACVSHAEVCDYTREHICRTYMCIHIQCTCGMISLSTNVHVGGKRW